MPDQASKLRLLATGSPPAPRAPSDVPPIVVVSGARAGVGVSTIVANLGAVLADADLRTIILDAAGDGVALAKAAGVGLPESGKSRIQTAPSGALLFTHHRDDHDASQDPRWQVRRWSAALQEVRHDANLIVVDAGSDVNAITRRLWQCARLVLLATTPDDPSIMDCYAKIKLGCGELTGDLRVLVNCCDSSSIARRVVERISTASERFLGTTVKAVPALPSTTFSGSQDRVPPRVWDSPDSAYGHAAQWLGRSVIEVLAAAPAAAELCASAAE